MPLRTPTLALVAQRIIPIGSSATTDDLDRENDEMSTSGSTTIGVDHVPPLDTGGPVEIGAMDTLRRAAEAARTVVDEAVVASTTVAAVSGESASPGGHSPERHDKPSPLADETAAPPQQETVMDSKATSCSLVVMSVRTRPAEKCGSTGRDMPEKQKLPATNGRSVNEDGLDPTKASSPQLPSSRKYGVSANVTHTVGGLQLPAGHDPPAAMATTHQPVPSSEPISATVLPGSSGQSCTILPSAAAAAHHPESASGTSLPKTEQDADERQSAGSLSASSSAASGRP